MALAHPPRQLVLRTPREFIALRLPLRGIVMAGLLLLALFIVSAISLATGSYGVALGEVWETLRGVTISRALDNVVWEFRFPRTICAALVGAMMALSGGVLQNATRNSLADPSLIGISQGAALAVVTLTDAFPEANSGLRPWIAFFGSVLVAAAIRALSHTRQGGSTIRFILLGIGLSAFISSITSILLTYGEIDRAMAALAWLAGSINAASWGDVWTLLGWTAALFPALLLLSRTMSALRFGEAAATGLGAPVTMVRNLQLVIAVGFAAIATSVVGPLGFVGLIAPHAAKRLAPAGMGLHLVLTALLGAVLVGLADLIGRAVFAPIQIPAGILTALIGVPVFVLLLIRSRHAQSH